MELHRLDHHYFQFRYEFTVRTVESPHGKFTACDCWRNHMVWAARRLRASLWTFEHAECAHGRTGDMCMFFWWILRAVSVAEYNEVGQFNHFMLNYSFTNWYIAFYRWQTPAIHCEQYLFLAVDAVPPLPNVSCHPIGRIHEGKGEISVEIFSNYSYASVE